MIFAILCLYPLKRKHMLIKIQCCNCYIFLEFYAPRVLSTPSIAREDPQWAWRGIRGICGSAAGGFFTWLDGSFLHFVVPQFDS